MASDLKFCTNCGTRMPDLSLLANAEPAPAPAPVPVPVPAPAQTPVTPSPVVTAAPATNRRGTTMRIVAAVIVVVLVLVAGTATFLGTRGMLPWQSVPVPSLDQLAGKQGATVDSLTADQVEAELRSEGFQTTRSQQYSGKNAGAFLSFSNVSEGQQLRHGDLVDIVESLGPGVPSGTVGAKAADSKQTLAGMNVPVTYRAVVTSVPGSSFGPADSSPQPGTVVATYPADGQPVTDTDKGITVAVATQSDTGIPVDYYGQDPDAVQADLESRGYTVTRKAKFSTKANVGKVVASDPALGTAAAAGTSVTLYYGVDSSSTHDVFTRIYIYLTTGGNDGPEAAQGTYCRKDGDCITLSKDCSGSYCDLYSSQTGSADVSGMTELFPCFFAQGTCMYNPDTTTSLGTDRAPHWEDSPLLFGNTGTFELTTWRQVTNGYCGTDGDWKYWKRETMSGGNSMQVCVDGQIRQDPGVDSSLDDPGYQMDDAWYVYVPVGADIKAVEDMGYFDADAMSQAASQ
ncbi:PASTA domain-containing protein, partial [Pseudoscardovia radai]|uniref:PASTA domain-containing protein n=1 Tax=Pseudoscardovia radai TaxID=987066 RepID=UPI001302FBDD